MPSVTPQSPLSADELARFIDRGRLLQSLALRDGARRIYRFLVSGCSLRGLRLAGSRQPCC